MGSGYRGTVDELTPPARERVRARTLGRFAATGSKAHRGGCGVWGSRERPQRAKELRTARISEGVSKGPLSAGGSPYRRGNVSSAPELSPMGTMAPAKERVYPFPGSRSPDRENVPDGGGMFQPSGIMFQPDGIMFRRLGRMFQPLDGTSVRLGECSVRFGWNIRRFGGMFQLPGGTFVQWVGTFSFLEERFPSGDGTLSRCDERGRRSAERAPGRQLLSPSPPAPDKLSPRERPPENLRRHPAHPPGEGGHLRPDRGAGRLPRPGADGGPGPEHDSGGRGGPLAAGGQRPGDDQPARRDRLGGGVPAPSARRGGGRFSKSGKDRPRPLRLGPGSLGPRKPRGRAAPYSGC